MPTTLIPHLLLEQKIFGTLMKKRGLFLATASFGQTKVHIHSMLQAELEDIRRSLSRIEETLDNNVIELGQPESDETRAA